MTYSLGAQALGEVVRTCCGVPTCRGSRGQTGCKDGDGPRDEDSQMDRQILMSTDSESRDRAWRAQGGWGQGDGGDLKGKSRRQGQRERANPQDMHLPRFGGRKTQCHSGRAETEAHTWAGG